jgi:hypothetical protein
MSVEAAMLKNRPSYLEPVRETPLPERHLVVLTFSATIRFCCGLF